MRIAIIGTGISGLTSAYLLSEDHEVVVFEANDYIGGHTNTVDVSLNGQKFAVDTGLNCAMLIDLGEAPRPAGASGDLWRGVAQPG